MIENCGVRFNRDFPDNLIYGTFQKVFAYITLLEPSEDVTEQTKRIAAT